MIEQQYYSRGSYGLTLHSAGHDTIAASDGLSEEQLRELNGFCQYYEGAPQSTNGERIPILSRRILPDGRILFSKRVPREYVDAGGRRRTFFMHNYIIPAGTPEEEDAVEDVRKISDPGIFATSFQEGNDPTRLSSLQTLPLKAQYDRFNALRLLFRNNLFSESFFLQILYAVLHSIDTPNKPVILFNDKFDNENLGALLVQAICSFLPYSMRKRFTYTTMQCSSVLEINYTLLLVHQYELENARQSRRLRGSIISDFFVFDRQSQSAVFEPVQITDPEDSFFAFAARKVQDPEAMDSLFVYWKKLEKELQLRSPALEDYDRLIRLYPDCDPSYETTYTVFMHYRSRQNSAFVDAQLNDAAQSFMREPHTAVPISVFQDWVRLCVDMDEANFIAWVELIKQAIRNTLHQGDKAGALEKLGCCLDSPQLQASIRSWAFHEEADLIRLTYTNKISQCDEPGELLDQYHGVCAEDESVLAVVRPIFLGRMDEMCNGIFRTGNNRAMEDAVCFLKDIFNVYAHFPERERAFLDKHIIQYAQKAIQHARKSEPKLTVEVHRCLDEIGRLIQVITLKQPLPIEITERLERSADILRIIRDASELERGYGWLDQGSEEMREELGFYYKELCSSFTEKDYPGLLYVHYDADKKVLRLDQVLSLLYKKADSKAFTAFLNWICEQKEYPKKEEYLADVFLDPSETEVLYTVYLQKYFLNSILKAACKISALQLSPKDSKSLSADIVGVIAKPLELGDQKNEFRNRLGRALNGERQILYRLKLAESEDDTEQEASDNEQKPEEEKKKSLIRIGDKKRKHWERKGVHGLLLWIVLCAVVFCLIVAGLCSTLPYAIRFKAMREEYQNTYAATVTKAQGEIKQVVEAVSFEEITAYLAGQTAGRQTQKESKTAVLKSSDEKNLTEAETTTETTTEPQTEPDTKAEETTATAESTAATTQKETSTTSSPFLVGNTMAADTQGLVFRSVSPEPMQMALDGMQQTERLPLKAKTDKAKTDADAGATKTPDAEPEDNVLQIPSYQNWNSICAHLDKKDRVESFTMRYGAGWLVKMDASCTFAAVQNGDVLVYFEIRDGIGTVIGARQALAGADPAASEEEPATTRWFDQNQTPLFVVYRVHGWLGDRYRYSAAQDGAKKASKAAIKEMMDGSALEKYYLFKNDEAVPKA